jgi:hypothetical protein
MKTFSLVAVLALATASHLVSTAARAQKADTLIKVKSEGAIAAAPAAADTAPKKKGMFGKLKSVAHNKTVQNVTKAALCTAVPGGQYMVAAAEAKKSGQSVASGVANSQSCIPGMSGAGMGGMGGMGGKTAIAGAAAQGIAGMQTAMAQANAASAATGGAGGLSTESSGEQMKLSGPVSDEIKKGKLVIKKIDWVHDNAAVSPSSTQGFMDLMMSAAEAMKSTGARYRVDVYTDKKYAEAEIATLGAQRAAMIVSLLQAGGQLGEAVVAGKIGKDKEQRVEIMKVK